MVKSAVKVVVRTRPTTSFAQHLIDVKDGVKVQYHIHSFTKKTINIIIPRKTKSYVDNQRTNYSFKFDNVLHNASQEAVYDHTASDVVYSCMEGFNGTIMAYGQTGAGKTFTMVCVLLNF